VAENSPAERPPRTKERYITLTEIVIVMTISKYIIQDDVSHSAYHYLDTTSDLRFIHTTIDEIALRQAPAAAGLHSLLERAKAKALALLN
jgi:hypothetical protein